MDQNNGIRRSRRDKVIGGVCGGLGRYLKLDPVIIRLVFIGLIVAGGGGVLIYIILWIILPEDESYQFQPPKSDATDNKETHQPKEDPEKTEVSSEPESLNETQSTNIQLVAGSIMIVVGGLFLASALIPRFNFIDIWPLALIALGVFLLKPTSINKK